MKTVKLFTLLCSIFTLTLCYSCEEFLSIKSDKKLATPRTAKDLQALLDFVEPMNYSLPNGIGIVGSDDMFLHDATWNAWTAQLRMEYTWKKEPLGSATFWNNPYSAVRSANTVISELDNVVFESPEERDHLLGSALFFRAYIQYHVAQIFAAPYHASNLDMDGIPYRRTSDVNVVTGRHSIKDTYAFILEDLKQAVRLLSKHRPLYPTRPYKGSAYAALARCYLSMGDYEQAGRYADSSLVLQHELMNFTDFPADAGSYPFHPFNPEVIFSSRGSATGSIAESAARVDSVLYTLYAENDHRKRLFFTLQSDGYHAYTGDFLQLASGVKFNGLTTSEMLLTRMEWNARANRLEKVREDLQVFINHRYASPLPAFLHLGQQELLNMVMEERRKELLFRGTRWTDLRRFSFDTQMAVDLRRHMNGQDIVLSAKDIQRFAYLIPQTVIDRSGLNQNP